MNDMKNMIKTGFLAIIAWVATSCGTTNQTVGASQVSRSDISGTWVVSNVSMENFPAGTQLGNVFDMAQYEGFQGSTWVLNGNGNGSISLSNGAVQPIYWSVNNNNSNSFQFKKLADGQRPRDVTTGYTLEFGDVTDDTAVIKSPITLSSGQRGFIVFNLTKQ